MMPQKVRHSALFFFLPHLTLTHVFPRADKAAAQHALDVAIGWYADPVYLGYYPPYMREMLGDRMPNFSKEEWEIVKGSSDFYGMNTYTTNLISESRFLYFLPGFYYHLNWY